MSTLPYIKIKEIRKKRGFSQHYMAEHLDISQMAYSKIECGKTQLNWEKIKKIAVVLNLSIWDLINETKGVDDIILDGKFKDKTIPLFEQLIENRDNKINELYKEIELLRKRLGTKE